MRRTGSENATKGLRIPRRFTVEGVDPFAGVKYEKRTSVIKNQDGSRVFEIKDVEVPAAWSQIATDILAQKYFRKTGVPQLNADGTPQFDDDGNPVLGPERSARQTLHRMANCWRHWGEQYGYFASKEDAQAFQDEITHMLLHQMTAPNSPQWFNTGLSLSYGIKGNKQGHWYVDPDDGNLKQSEDAYTRAQVHACFIQSVKDDLLDEGGIFDLVTREARVFKYGSGTGTNFSNLRGAGEPLSGGGRSSGLMSFLKINDRAAGAIKSGGTTRRAAKMVCLDMDHPEIEAFIDWKMLEEQKVADLVTGAISLKQGLGGIMQAAKENADLKENANLRSAVRKAIALNIPLNVIGRTLQLAAAGETDLRLLNLDTHFEGEAYNTVSGQNSNNSIRIPNKFFRALDSNEEWPLIRRLDGKVHKVLNAKDLWNRVTFAAWASADPGVQYDDTINEWHTCPEDGRINASNPCVTADTLVPTKDGRWKRIKDMVATPQEIIVNPGLVMNAPIKGAFKTGTKQVYRLTTEHGYEVKLTADHKMLTAERGWVEAAKLTKEDSLLLPATPIADIAPIDDPTFYNLLGVYLGDGCGSGGTTMQLTMDAATETPILETFAEYTAEYGRITHKNHPATVQLTKTSGKFTVSNQVLINKATQYVDLAQKSHQKRLSDAIFGLTLSEQRHVLRGLFTADGTVVDSGEKSQYVGLDSTSLGLLKDVQVLLTGFGIKSKIYENRRAGKLTASLPDGNGGMKEYDVRETHSLRITRHGRILFEGMIGFMPESPKAAALTRLNITKGTYADKPIDRVASFEPLGEEDVYDLTEPFTHSFIANGLTVHNCSEYMFLDDTACNLASLNLAKFLDEENRFAIEDFKHGSRLWTIVLEISVLMAQFPSKEIAKLSYDFRTLGLGYANLGTILMRSGIPYDSEEARAIAGAITAIMCGESYATSAEMAAALGPFPGYARNAEHMLRVMRNHRRAAYDADVEEYEGLTITPVGINAEYCPAKLLEAARETWDRAVSLGEEHGYRNAQVTVIAPTGTIGLVMDCDTTGVEPDFALVKFKKLAGGGYLKIVNQSVPAALATLGYDEEQVNKIIKYATGHGTLAGCPHINHVTLRDRGFTDEKIEAIEKQLASAFDITFAVTKYALGEDFLRKIGLTEAQLANPMTNVLSALEFTNEEIAAANAYVCGTMTVEGAPGLKEEHLPVFDCANRCGRNGKRFIAYEAHIRMMAAAQPFISGAISKTINMPKEASIEDIGAAYRLSWSLMVKANALYRDGCKLSQPLNATSSDLDAELLSLQSEEDIDETVSSESVQLAIGRKMLPARREGFSHEVMVGGHSMTVKTGEYEDGTLGELAIDMYKEGGTYRCLVNAFADAVTLGLQHGVPLQTFVDSMTFRKFEPAGAVMGDAQIKQATSPVDYVFRLLASEYLGDTTMVHVKDAARNAKRPESHQTVLASEEGSVAARMAATSTNAIAKDQGFTGESCGQCGSMKVKQNGTCSLCLDCGTTSGCS